MSRLPGVTAEAPPKPHNHCCPRCQVVMSFKEYWPAHKPGLGPKGSWVGWVWKVGSGITPEAALPANSTP